MGAALKTFLAIFLTFVLVYSKVHSQKISPGTVAIRLQGEWQLSQARMQAHLRQYVPFSRRQAVPYSRYGRQAVPYSRYGRQAVPYSRYGRQAVPYSRYGRQAVPYSRQAAPYSRYGRQAVPYSRYGRQAVPYSRYGRQAVPYSRYGRQAVPYSRYGRQAVPYSRYGRQAVPYSRQAVPYSRYGRQAVPYSRHGPSDTPAFEPSSPAKPLEPSDNSQPNLLSILRGVGYRSNSKCEDVLGRSCEVSSDCTGCFGLFECSETSQNCVLKAFEGLALSSAACLSSNELQDNLLKVSMHSLQVLRVRTRTATKQIYSFDPHMLDTNLKHMWNPSRAACSTKGLSCGTVSLLISGN
ncbi:uncharacterized protein LOC144909037 [Branchiostoma floridae x Branchiostoma belcheri]